MREAPTRAAIAAGLIITVYLRDALSENGLFHTLFDSHVFLFRAAAVMHRPDELNSLLRRPTFLNVTID